MKRVLVVITVLLVAGASQAGLNDPAVLNPSFESPDLGAGGAGAWGWYAEGVAEFSGIVMLPLFGGSSNDSRYLTALKRSEPLWALLPGGPIASRPL